MRKYITLLALLLSQLSASAGMTSQRVILTDGTVLYGFIQTSDGYGNYTVWYDRAEVYIPASNNPTITNSEILSLKDLSPEWVEWAEAHNAFNGTGDSRTLTLHTVTSTSVNATRVRVLEGGTHFRYLKFCPKGETRYLEKGQFARVEADKRDKLELSGVDVTFMLKDSRTFSGQYAGETDSTYSVYTEQGFVQTFPYALVAKCTYQAIDPNKSILYQSPLLDILYTKNAGNLEGVIVEKNYTGKSNNERSFVIETKAGRQTVQLSNLSSVGRMKNPDYQPKTDILLADSVVVINRQNTAVITLREDAFWLICDTIPEGVAIVQKQTGENTYAICAEYNYPNAKYVDPFSLVPVQTLTKTEKKSKEARYYGFNYKDLDTDIKPTKRETSVNGTTSADYVVASPGLYALYDRTTRKAVLLQLE